MRFVLGLLSGLGGLLLFAEGLARLQPPSDLQPYLGELSSMTGPYRPDSALGADYRSFADFEAENAARLAELGPIETRARTWAFFGNSFIQAPGMLAATMETASPETRIFYLKRNEPLALRVAQVRLLLAHGLRPERIVFALLPVDCVPLGRQPLSSIFVTARGAISYRMRLPPPPWDLFVRHSRIAATAWVRSDRHVFDPSFRGRDLTERVTPALAQDLRTLIATLHEVGAAHGTRVTILLIPNREQIQGTGGFALQDAVLNICRAEGADCLDARDVFRGEMDQRSLFLPDWHFTPRGNEMLAARLLAHFEATPLDQPLPAQP